MTTAIATPAQTWTYEARDLTNAAPEKQPCMVGYVSTVPTDGSWAREIAVLYGADDRDAHGRLIAAAPQMLAALRRLTESLNDELDAEQAAAWDDAMDAIAKAEGR